ncbi:Ran-binding protein 9 [Globodera pallida]|nr:Ran-binding protein 9 [Globodera pallida]
MRLFLFLGAVCLLVADASPPPKTNTKLENELSSSGNAETNAGVRFVLAKKPIPNEKSGIFYFEVEILAFTGPISMGLATKKLELNKSESVKKQVYVVGNQVYAYDSSGYITGLDFNDNHAFIVNNKIVGETFVGCGVDLEKGQIFYTKNGEFLGTAKLSDDVKVHELFPCVSMQTNGCKIEANFGSKEFKFDLAKEWERYGKAKFYNNRQSWLKK